jgi:hypothetical protein
VSEPLVTPDRETLAKAPSEPGWYAYSDGRQSMIFHLRDTGQWSAHFANGTASDCAWGYIEQALSVWDLVPLVPAAEYREQIGLTRDDLDVIENALEIAADLDEDYDAADTLDRFRAALTPKGPANQPRPLPTHRTEVGYPRCSTCDGGGCYDCTDPA